MSEPMSGRQFREERARLEAEQGQVPQEITVSRKTAFRAGIWAAAGATVWFVIMLPIILVVMFVFALNPPV